MWDIENGYVISKKSGMMEARIPGVKGCDKENGRIITKIGDEIFQMKQYSLQELENMLF